MASQDLALKIDELLRRSLLDYHIAQLRDLKSKENRGDLSQSDQDYVVDMWNRFGSLPTATETRDGGSVTAAPNEAPTATETELEEAKQTIATLREAGERAVVQRDQWEARAKQLEKQFTDLRRQEGHRDRKFEQAKRVFAKLYHPNAAIARSPLEAMIVGDVFKEFWAELERIELED